MNKTISIFLASSSELENDRIEFGDFVRQLDDIYEKRGTRLSLLKWENFDSSISGRKQDDYNEKIKICNIFLALFYTKAGRYTVEEFHEAYKEFQLKNSPKIYVYCKDLQLGDKELPDLTRFKKWLEKDLGHYCCHYSNRERLHLDFTIQLLRFENINLRALQVDEDGKITFDRMPIADINQMPFVTNNTDYQKKLSELQILPGKIEKIQRLIEQVPDSQYLLDDYQFQTKHFEELKRDCYQFLVRNLNTAKYIAEIQTNKVNALMQKAIDAFEAGNIEQATALLDILFDDTIQHMKSFDQNRELAHQGIKAARLNANTVMADLEKPISDRIDRVTAIYEQAEDWASRSAYPPEEHIALLLEYAEFLYQYIPRFHSKALKICDRILYLYNGIEEVDNNLQFNLAACYNLMGKIHSEQDELILAQECYETALEVAKKDNNLNQTEIARYIANIGGSYYDLGLYDDALKYYLEAATLFEKLEKEGAKTHILLATTYDNIGQVSAINNDHQKALDFFNKALATYKKGDEQKSQIRIAHVYHNIGAVYQECCNYEKALVAYQEALGRREKEFGFFHTETAISYFSIGMLYSEQQKYSEALEFLSKALNIQEQILGNEHSDTERTRKLIQSTRERIK